jgi:hypothetical protein
MFGVAIRRRAAPEGVNVAGEPDHGRVKQTILSHRGQVARDQESGGYDDFGPFVRVVAMEIRPMFLWTATGRNPAACTSQRMDACRHGENARMRHDRRPRREDARGPDESVVSA